MPMGLEEKGLVVKHLAVEKARATAVVFCAMKTNAYSNERPISGSFISVPVSSSSSSSSSSSFSSGPHTFKQVLITK